MTVDELYAELLTGPCPNCEKPGMACSECVHAALARAHAEGLEAALREALAEACDPCTARIRSLIPAAPEVIDG